MQDYENIHPLALFPLLSLIEPFHIAYIFVYDALSDISGVGYVYFPLGGSKAFSSVMIGQCTSIVAFTDTVYYKEDQYLHTMP